MWIQYCNFENRIACKYVNRLFAVKILGEKSKFGLFGEIRSSYYMQDAIEVFDNYNSCEAEINNFCIAIAEDEKLFKTVDVLKADTVEEEESPPPKPELTEETPEE